MHGQNINMLTTLFAAVCVLLTSKVAASPVLVETFSDFSDLTFNVTNDAAFRLPTTVRPSRYEVTLTPYFDTNDTNAFTFDGEVDITIQPQAIGISQIVLHYNDLTINVPDVTVSDVNGNLVALSAVNPIVFDVDYDFLIINLATQMVMTQQYNINIVYRGNLQTGMRGFYRSWYSDNGIIRWMGTTQFQPGHARKAFPCFDEPSFKAIFVITMNRPADFSPTISNMPIQNTTTLASGRVSETFYPTPLTSTYLIAFIVSHYQATDITPENSTRPFGIYARASASDNGLYAFEVGQDILLAMENYTNFPYYTMASNMKMDQAAIPDFSAGAMENYGLLTYREALILYDNVHSSDFYKQRISNIIAHEVAHMWFGNLVTCEWWDVLWLNEGFARYYQFYLTGLVETEMGFDIRFVSEQLQVSLFSDSIDSAHPMTNPEGVFSPTTVSAHFSQITYGKGASVIRMTEHLLGSSTLLSGLRNYLVDRAFNTATPEQLYASLQSAANTDAALTQYPNITIAEYMDTWTRQAGNPLITVNVDVATGNVEISQARFNRNTGNSTIAGFWQVPITFTTQGALDFQNTKPSFILTAQSDTFNKGSNTTEWVMLNIQQTGFYRVNYDDANWDRIVAYLRSDQRENVHENNRAQIVDDAFALARAGVISYGKAFDIISILELETTYGPWFAAVTAFNFLRRQFSGPNEVQTLANLDTYINQLSEHFVNIYGFYEMANETFMEGMVRYYVAPLLCDIGHPACIASAVAQFQALRNNGTEVPANLRPWVYCSALRAGDASDYDFMWNRYQAHNVYNEKIVILAALGCTRNTDSVRHFLTQTITDGSGIRPQDLSVAFSAAVTGNAENPQTVFEWLTENYLTVSDVYEGLGTPLSTLAARLMSEQQIAEFESWVVSVQGEIGAAFDTATAAISGARSTIQWTADRVELVNEWFENNIESATTVVDTTTTTTTTTTVAPTTTVPTTTEEVTAEPVTDSAAVTGAGAVLLLLASSIHVMINRRN